MAAMDLMALMAVIALMVVVPLMAYGFYSWNGFNGCNNLLNAMNFLEYLYRLSDTLCHLIVRETIIFINNITIMWPILVLSGKSLILYQNNFLQSHGIA